MGIIGIIWVVLIVLKVLGVALVTTSWLTVIFWPIIPIIILFVIALVFGLGAAAFTSFIPRR